MERRGVARAGGRETRSAVHTTASATLLAHVSNHHKRASAVISAVCESVHAPLVLLDTTQIDRDALRCSPELQAIHAVVHGRSSPLHIAAQACGLAPNNGLRGGVQGVCLQGSVGVDRSGDRGGGTHGTLEGATRGVRVVRTGQWGRGSDGAVGACGVHRVRGGEGSLRSQRRGLAAQATLAPSTTPHIRSPPPKDAQVNTPSPCNTHSHTRTVGSESRPDRAQTQALTRRARRSAKRHL
jgi:hypothetical protein